MNLEFPESTRAPGRGRYAREHSNAERFVVQRARLLRATAIAYLDGDASVTRVTALSGVGRNTFYECFDDFGHALAALRKEEVRRVQRGLAALGATSVGDGLERLCGGWTALIEAEPVRALATLGLERGQASSELLAAFRGALKLALPPASRQSEALLIHAAACAETSARVVALSMVSAPASSLAALLGAAGAAPSGAGLVLARSIRRLVG